MFWNKIIANRVYKKAEKQAISDGQSKTRIIQWYYNDLTDVNEKSKFEDLLPSGYIMSKKGLWNFEIYGNPEATYHKQEEQYIVFLFDFKNGLFDQVWERAHTWYTNYTAVRNSAHKKAEQFINSHLINNQLLIPSQANDLLIPATESLK